MANKYIAWFVSEGAVTVMVLKDAAKEYIRAESPQIPNIITPSAEKAKGAGGGLSA